MKSELSHCHSRIRKYAVVDAINEVGSLRRASRFCRSSGGEFRGNKRQIRDVFETADVVERLDIYHSSDMCATNNVRFSSKYWVTETQSTGRIAILRI
ncbi:hypothetical protein AVEN_9471-1 [Araneus ventricosus]|uniref:Uncharacterized protein n=1 Tax=Araneus ventricosus TaxID=182803 RepID=A0A4Y2PKH3_ARAVE|nr:hypothetical protein AVEN_9471-1 [Araneus ventricosus]